MTFSPRVPPRYTWTRATKGIARAAARNGSLAASPCPNARDSTLAPRKTATETDVDGDPPGRRHVHPEPGRRSRDERELRGEGHDPERRPPQHPSDEDVRDEGCDHVDGETRDVLPGPRQDRAPIVSTRGIQAPGGAPPPRPPPRRSAPDPRSGGRRTPPSPPRRPLRLRPGTAAPTRSGEPRKEPRPPPGSSAPGPPGGRTPGPPQDPRLGLPRPGRPRSDGRPRASRPAPPRSGRGSGCTGARPPGSGRGPARRTAP